MTNAEPLFEALHISKAYPGVQALNDVSFELRAGEIHALVGVNGAGKSTLVKIMVGAERPDSGTMRLRGRELRPRSTLEAMEQGVTAVHQERTLVPHLTVPENIFLGMEPGQYGIIDNRTMMARAQELVNRFGISLPMRTEALFLGAGERQLVDILKALRSHPAVLVLDEPTAALSKGEAERLFAALRLLSGEGIGIIFVSHRLDEIFDISNRITVLRDGKHVATRNISEISQDQVVRLMVNRDVVFETQGTSETTGEVLLEVRDFSGDRFDNVSLSVHVGEVVGLAGVVGAGRTELLETIIGFRRARSGTILLKGKPVRIHAPEDAVDLGICLVPEKRTEKGLCESLTVRDNVSLPSLARFSHAGVVSQSEEDGATREVVETLRIATPRIDFKVKNLSGGNKQKVVFGKWLLAAKDVSGKIFLFDEPTEGVDVGVKAEMWAIIRDLAARGAGIIVASSEMEELMYLSDTLVAVRGGHVVGQVARIDADHEQLLNWMMADTAVSG
jgi:ribose transport system ATP-binding protein